MLLLQFTALKSLFISIFHPGEVIGATVREKIELIDLQDHDILGSLELKVEGLLEISFFNPFAHVDAIASGGFQFSDDGVGNSFPIPVFTLRFEGAIPPAPFVNFYMKTGKVFSIRAYHINIEPAPGENFITEEKHSNHEQLKEEFSHDFEPRHVWILNQSQKWMPRPLLSYLSAIR